MNQSSSFVFLKKSVLEYNAHFSKTFLIKILLFNSKRGWKGYFCQDHHKGEKDYNLLIHMLSS